MNIGVRDKSPSCNVQTQTLENDWLPRFVGYLEEQAVITYTHILNQIDSGQLPSWSSLSAPDTAIE